MDMNVNMNELNALVGKMLNEMGAAANGVLVMIGDKLGLFRSLSEHGPLTAAELADRTGTYERYVREWLAAQAASGLVCYDPGSGRFSMTPEQTAVLADEESPAFMIGGFQSAAAVYAGETRLTHAFRSGEGIGWEQHCPCLFCGIERFFRPGYRANLVAEWLPALDGVVDKLRRGTRVADVGCGHGASTAIMAAAFPKSEFVGFDFHEGSIVEARQKTAHLPNLRFEVGRAQDYPGTEYGLVTVFDALHDMGDPSGAASHIRQTLAPDGTLMLVEPMAGDRLDENLNPVGRCYYAFSTSLCVPGALSQDGRAALGAQAGQRRLTEVLAGAGFNKVRRAAETPFNMVLEARA